jgi:hypothetical protein
MNADTADSAFDRFEIASDSRDETARGDARATIEQGICPSFYRVDLPVRFVILRT